MAEYTKTYHINRVYEHGEEAYDCYDEVIFLTREEDGKVVFATLTSMADRTMYFWQAEGYVLEIYNGTFGRADFEALKNNRAKVYTAYEFEKVSSIAELLRKGNIDTDEIDLSKYKILGEETPRKITNAEIMEAINCLTELVLKLVEKQT